MAGRKGDYLFKRGDMYWVKFQYPKELGIKTLQRTTGKRNYDEAWLAVANDIIEHKQFLALRNQIKRGMTQQWIMPESDSAAHKPMRDMFAKLKQVIEEGRSVLDLATEEDIAEHEQVRAMHDKLKATLAQPLSLQDIVELITSPARPSQEPFTTVENADGTTSFATPTEVFVNANGKTVATRPNESIVGIKPIFMTENERRGILIATQRKEQLTNRTGDTDWQIVNAYIDAKNKSKAWEREAREVYEDWRRIVGKTFNRADLPDGEKLAQYYLKEHVPLKARKTGVQGIKTATVAKKLNFLSAPINHQLKNKNPKIRFNPFRGVVPDVRDATRKSPLYNEDLKRIDRNLDKLGSNERLLYLICRHTGCRRGEAWQIEETREKGLRVIWFGSKNEQSVRRIPIPDALLPHLPTQIDGSLFTDDPINVGKNLNRAMRRFGITDETKTLHSFRHRAKDRLRAEACPVDVQWAILGHEKKTVADGYGKGFAMTVLKPYVELIGCYDEASFAPDPDAYNDDADT
ncbi:hypothetical protein [Microvirga terricola]|uniref:Tyr recombinase domain-containing protein n=1 Tax=Microvirga terricola TaxID=2719797 RepID=A0ABX0V6F3_9HYPH|nr:hypothetical protein [Microvirga terricola]NIX75313.1 hypothetical protein [Microvirga terricola]